MTDRDTDIIRDAVDFFCLSAAAPLSARRLSTMLYLADRASLLKGHYHITDDDYRNDDGLVFGVRSTEFLGGVSDAEGMVTATPDATLSYLGTLSVFKTRMLDGVRALVEHMSDDDVADMASDTFRFPESGFRGEIPLLDLCRTIGIDEAEAVVEHIEEARGIRRSFAAMEEQAA